MSGQPANIRQTIGSAIKLVSRELVWLHVAVLQKVARWIFSRAVSICSRKDIHRSDSNSFADRAWACNADLGSIFGPQFSVSNIDTVRPVWRYFHILATVGLQVSPNQNTWEQIASDIIPGPQLFS